VGCRLQRREPTGSILDIVRVCEEPEVFCAAPLTAEELQRCFGTERPTVEMVEDSDAFWDDMDRGKARYVIIYEGDVPKKIFFGGYSFDRGTGRHLKGRIWRRRGCEVGEGARDGRLWCILFAGAVIRRRRSR